MSIRARVIILVFFVSVVPTFAQEVYFRHDFGVAETKSVPLHFDDSTTLWKVPLPEGHSTPTIHEDLIYVTTFDPSSEQHATVCLNRENGKQVWRRVAPTTFVEQQHQIGSPASATVATDGQRVYSFFGGFGLLCYTMDGKPVWSVPLGPFQDEFGSSSSPILVNGRLLLNEDHDTNNFLLCLDAATGDEIWKTSRDAFTRSYATPAVWKHDGKTEIIVAGALQLTSYDLETGQELWWVNGLARIVNTTPVVEQDRILVATWSPGGNVGERISMESWQAASKKLDTNNDQKITRDELKPGAVLTRFFRIDLNQDKGLDEYEWNRHASVFERAQNLVISVRPGGRGDMTESAIAWKNPVGAPYVSSPLVHDGVVYLAKDGGIFTTINVETGEVLKRARLRGGGNYYSSPVVAGSKVLIASQKGMLSVLNAAGNWSTITTHDFQEEIYATPVFDADRLFVRTKQHLYCFATPR